MERLPGQVALAEPLEPGGDAHRIAPPAGLPNLTRMDYLDQFFDPEAYAARHEARPPAPQRPAPPAASPRPAPAPAPPAAPRGEGEGEAMEQASAAPAEDRDQWIRSTVRQHPWLALNWAQLTPAQQQRVEARLADAGGGRLMPNGEPAAAWDTMGLDDRTDLAFGTSREGNYATRRR